MLKSADRALRVSTGILMILGCISLTTVNTFGVEIVIIPAVILACAPLGERLDRRSPSYRKATRLITLFFTLGILPLLWSRLGLLVALTVLCIYIQAFLFLHVRRFRDYQYLFLMSFFLLVSACAQNPEPSFGLVIPAFMMAIVWAFAMLQLLKDRASAPESAIAEILPEEGQGRFMPSESLATMQQPALIGRSMILYLTGAATTSILLALILFVITPRMEAGVLGGRNLELRSSDVPSSLDLAASGRIVSSPTPVMRVRFPEEPGGEPSFPLYWRVTAMNRYIGSRWERVGIFEEEFRDQPSRTFFSSEGNNITRSSRRGTREVVQDVYLDDPPPFGVPCLPFPKTVSIRAGRVAWDNAGDYTVVIRSQRNSAVNYTVTSEVPIVDEDALRQYPARYAQLQGERDFPFLYERVIGRQAYNALTQEELSQRCRDLTVEITQPFNNPYDKAQAIVDWFKKTDFVYTFDLPKVEGDPIDSFLFVTRAGHCELYASAMALMLRSLGIPARVVSGYRGGEWEAGDESYIVRKNMAHLWVEVYFIGHGWVMFDPTPDVDLPENEISDLARIISRNILSIKMFWFRDVVGYTGSIRLGDVGELTLGLIGFDFEVVKQVLLTRPLLSDALPRFVFWFILLSTIVAFAIYVLTRPKAKPIIQVEFSSDQIGATRLFWRLKRRLRKLGVECAGMTAGEVYASLEGDLSRHAMAVGQILEAYRQTRFGGRPLDRRQYRKLKRMVRRIGRTEPSA